MTNLTKIDVDDAFNLFVEAKGLKIPYRKYFRSSRSGYYYPDGIYLSYQFYSPSGDIGEGYQSLDLKFNPYAQEWDISTMKREIEILLSQIEHQEGKILPGLFLEEIFSED